MAMDVPLEEDYEKELAEAWDDIGGQELDPEVGMVQADECVREETHRGVLDKTKKPPIKVKWMNHNQREQTKHERKVEAGGKAHQHR